MASSGSSKSTPKPDTPQCCAVCLAADAKYRCPRCAEAGVVLAFCCTEHQKLVWPVHKDVCGKKSRSCNPFLHVRLSPVEAAEAKRDKLKVGIPGMEGLPDHMPTKLQISFERSGIPPQAFDAVIDSLAGPRDDWALPATCPNSPFQIIRSTRYFRAQNSTGVPFFEPWSILAQYENTLNTSGVKTCNMFSALYQPLCHRMLCFLAAMEKEHQKQGHGRAWETYRDDRFRLVASRLQELVAAEGNPEVVPVVANAVAEAWMCMSGQM
ncbi:hypothetical protein JCM6882_008334 [Rhodosporidiobolus microsporus]